MAEDICTEEEYEHRLFFLISFKFHAICSHANTERYEGTRRLGPSLC